MGGQYILDVLVLGRISVKAEMSRTAMYMPDDPESAFNCLETEKLVPRSAVRSLFSGVHDDIAE